MKALGVFKTILRTYTHTLNCHYIVLEYDIIWEHSREKELLLSMIVLTLPNIVFR